MAHECDIEILLGNERPGFNVFKPTDEELVNYYLLGKIQHGEDFVEVHRDCIRMANLYAQHPQVLMAGAALGDFRYFFSPVFRNELPNGTSIRRLVDNAGSWDSNGRSTIVGIGRKVPLRHVIGGASTGYYAEEFFIEGYRRPAGELMFDLLLYKIVLRKQR
ncbi:hypothetical protein MKW92_000448 [Papaver armeniacum]|nr:hypothetical protein MKW92_000448 [Papaver armeniacum]